MNGGALDYRGRYFELNDVPLTLLPNQRPRPPMWIATTRPESAAWAAANGFNVACLGPAASVRGIAETFRANRHQIIGADKRDPFFGIVRMVVISHSHHHAYALASSAYEQWLTSFKFLYDRNAIATPPALPLTFDAAIERELCVVGTAASVRNELLNQAEKAGANYLFCQVAFGNLPLDASLYTAAAIHSDIMAEYSRVAAFQP
jgi:alkanesulfonate monooxygenase SsuD/methylene tetrahydromethanopterin reductase-like flavin-dependent oxidoreductase (luciferase family)